MSPEEFVEAVRDVVMESAVNGTISVFKSPPGRRPASELVELSRWYLSLREEDRNMVRRVLAFGVRDAVFGLFCVIDGVRQIEPEGPKGDLELVFRKDGVETHLGGSRGAVLHELL